MGILNYSAAEIQRAAEERVKELEREKEARKKQKNFAAASFVRYLTSDNALMAIKQFAYDNRDKATKEALDDELSDEAKLKKLTELKIHQTYVDWIEVAEKDGRRALKELNTKGEEVPEEKEET